MNLNKAPVNNIERSDPETPHRKKRRNAIIHGLLSAVANRFVGMAVGVLSVPLAVGYLGAERYGIWVTIGSTLAWLQFTDLGIANGLTNVVTKCLANNQAEEAQRQVSTAFYAIALMSLMLATVFTIVWPHIHWPDLFGIKGALARSETPPAVAGALVTTLLQFPLSIVNKLYLALQEGKRVNYWATTGNILSLLALLTVVHTHGGLIWLVIAVSGAGTATSILSGIWLFHYHRPDLAPKLTLITFSATAELRSLSSKFLMLQLMSLIVFQTDNFVIAHFLGAEKVAPYSLAYRLFGYTYLVQTVLFAYLWAAFSDALARGELVWIRRTFTSYLGLSILATAVMTVPLSIFARSIIRLWAGPTVVPSSSLCWWMAAWSVINSVTSPMACLFAAANHTTSQIYYSTLATIANVCLTIILLLKWGVSGVIAGTVLSYAVFIIGPMSVDTMILLNRLRAEGSKAVAVSLG